MPIHSKNLGWILETANLAFAHLEGADLMGVNLEKVIIVF